MAFDSLKGKVALVTGAGRGIGRVTALRLAAHGAAVALNYSRSEEGARLAAEEIRIGGGEAWTMRADIGRVDEARQLVTDTVARGGRLDILANNAGLDPRRPFFDVDEEFWDSVIDTNLKGTFFCAQAAAADMRKRGRGRIINISSVHGRLTMANYAAYAASKGGMDALTRQLALTWRRSALQ